MGQGRADTFPLKLDNPVYAAAGEYLRCRWFGATCLWRRFRLSGTFSGEIEDFRIESTDSRTPLKAAHKSQKRKSEKNWKLQTMKTKRCSKERIIISPFEASQDFVKGQPLTF
jgi:hypothetical protein